MEYYTRYSGSFVAVDGTIYRADIEQKSAAPFSVGELTFPAEEPLTIEWDTTDKEEVLHGSTATMQIESPGDRTYIDLYTIEVGNIRLSVYRNGTLYWRGCLDPEFYEEPYEAYDKYDVSLTFTDFGIMDRLKYSLQGYQTLRAIVEDAVSRSGLGYSVATMLTTSVEGGTADTLLDDICILSENFCDEDGEWDTLQEALEAIFLPLGIHMQSTTEGSVILYDLNAVATSTETEEVYWNSDSQTLGVDKVANNVKITFSPYVSDEVLTTELEYTDDYKEQRKNGEAFDVYNCYMKDGKGVWDMYRSYWLALSENGKGLAYLNTKARYGHIEPVLGSASEETAVVWLSVTNQAALNTIKFDNAAASNITGSTYAAEGYVTNYPALAYMSDSDYQPLMRTTKACVVPGEDTMLKVSLEILADARYNPFEDEEQDDNQLNEKDNYELISGSKSRVFFVPCTIVLYDGEGNAIYHYQNYKVDKTINYYGNTNINPFTLYDAGWKSGDADPSDPCFLVYYDNSDRGTFCEESCFDGFTTNKYSLLLQQFGVCKKTDVKYPTTGLDEGEYLPLPPEMGYIEVTIYTGGIVYQITSGTSAFLDQGFLGDTTTTGGGAKKPQLDDILSGGTPHSQRYQLKFQKEGCAYRIRHLMYKAPQIEYVDAITGENIDADDIEYSGYINKDAEDNIELDTTCGTSSDELPTARGIYRKAADLTPITELTRAGITDCPERLLIGTLYSQFATRHTTLTGDADIPVSGKRSAMAYTEQNQDGKVFWLSGEVQDLITNTSEMTLIEVSPDEFHAIEEVEE